MGTEATKGESALTVNTLRYNLDNCDIHMSSFILPPTEMTLLEDLGVVSVTEVPWDLVKDYKLIFIHGYKENVDLPNQVSFVLLPECIPESPYESAEYVRISARASHSGAQSGWQYGIIVKRWYGKLFFYTDIDYSGNTRFIVSKILGAK